MIRQSKKPGKETSKSQIQIIKPQESLVVGFSGPRGSGKTLAMSYLSLIDMKRGHPVLANYTIGGHVKRGQYEYEVNSKPLEFTKMLELSESLQYCITCIDEINLWFASTKWMTQGNRLMQITLQQLRKRAMSLYYTTQNIRWVDNQIRWQTDLHVMCHDMSRTPQGIEAGLHRGEYIRLAIMDLSGYLTGRPYDESGEVYHAMLDARPIWNCYNTENIVDPWEAMAKVELKRPKVMLDLTGEQPDPLAGSEPLPALSEIEKQIRERWEKEN